MGYERYTRQTDGKLYWRRKSTTGEAGAYVASAAITNNELSMTMSDGAQVVATGKVGHFVESPSNPNNISYSDGVVSFKETGWIW